MIYTKNAIPTNLLNMHRDIKLVIKSFIKKRVTQKYQ